MNNSPSYTFHSANDRGHADHGWLNSYHSFSFAGFHDPKKMNFGLLRVLNDDTVAPGRGFGTHPHDNMEIISIPLEGDLEHKDSMGNTTVIRQGDVQVMSAGTGILHSEYNKNSDQEVKFLQIWVFPRERNIEPRYGQKHFPANERLNRFERIVAPDDESAIWINQNAYFSLGNFERGKHENYELVNEEHGVYAFVIKGKVGIDGNLLNERDALGIAGKDSISIEFHDHSELLLIDLPMALRP